MDEKKFDFKKFIDDSKQALLNPKEYFSSFSSDEGIGILIIKALIYGAVAGVFALLWSVIGLSVIDVGFLSGAIGGTIGVMAFIWSIIGAVIALFIGGIIILIISSICNGNADFEANLRVSAVLLVLMPINAFLELFTGFSYFLGAIIGLAVNFWAIWMLYNALIHNLNAKPETSKVVAYVLAGVLVLFMIIGLAVRGAVSNFAGFGNKDARNLVKEYGKNANKFMKEAEKVSKDYEKAAEEMAKDYKAAAKEMEKYAEGINEEAFTIEMANGNTYDDIDKSTIRKALKNLDEDNDFMILTKGDNYIQTAVYDDNFVVEYSDKTGYFRSVNNEIDLDDVKDMFYGFFSEEKDWKEITEWELAE